MKNTNGEGASIDPKEMERQLRCPSGQTGIEVANVMNESNIGMTLNTINLLDLQDGHSVLELGHGNAGHLRKLMAKAQGLKYYGLEMSETMYHEARNKHQDLLDNGAVSFQLYDGLRIPFHDDFFDGIMTVNTLYFWQNPESLINEIGRILRPGGYCVVSFGQKEMMKKIPFVGSLFRLYDDNDFRELVAKSALELVDIVMKTEQIKLKSGEFGERPYFMAKLRKPLSGR